ncbi:MAG: SIMPL domain-containing protein, partial [Syntrophomonadaceae bacterium]|nr:SIMPL domain-containing protein [Syntrophomonadaceae bacterium]
MRVPRFVRESRRLAALVLAALLVVGVASPAAMAQVQANAPTLSVTGMGTVTVAPDQARASLAVTTNDRLLAAAQEANTAITQKVMEALLASGVAREDIQTTSFTVWPQYSYPSPENPTQPPTIIGYQVRNELTVTVKTIANLGRVLDAGL